MGQPLDLNNLTARIREAFSKREYPGDEFLVIDMSGADWDQIELLGTLRGKHWDEVPIEAIHANPNALSFLTEEAFRFYLPAFMLEALTQADPILVKYLIYSLTPPNTMIKALESLFNIPEDILTQLPPDTQEIVRQSKELLQEVMDEGGGEEQVHQRQQSWFESKMSGFMPDEKAVIRDYLKYMADDGDTDAQKALDGYWKNTDS